MEEEAKSSNLGVVYWMRECLVGSAGEQTSEQMTTYLGIPQTAAKSSNLGVVCVSGSSKLQWGWVSGDPPQR